MKTRRLTTLLFSAALTASSCFAGINQNPNKFLGNITTGGGEDCDIRSCNLTYSDYWDQATCENGCKWGSVHQGWGRFNWSTADKTYNYCKQKGLIFKFHAFIWGSQHPSWIENLSVDDTKKAIIEWFDEIKRHYPDLKIIDVVNEAIYSGGNYHSPYKSTKIIQALGSLAEDRAQKETGRRPSYNCNTNGYPNDNSYQWLAEAFRLARERFPNAILIYNDYNTFQWQKTEFINLVNGIKKCGGPIDAAGNQAHDLNDMSGTQFKNALEEIHNKTQLPQYITEYDINKADDGIFLTRYKEQFPVMWEADYVAGVTLWGWIFGQTWVSDNGVRGASGLVKNCQKRSAFTWLEQYMKTDAAKNAKAPKVGGPSVSGSIQLSKESVEAGSKVDIAVVANASEGINYFELYIGNDLVAKESIEAYKAEYTPTEAGSVDVKLIVVDKKGNQNETKTTITVCDARAPFNGTMIELPGIIEAENFDSGCEGITAMDSDKKNEGAAEDGGVDYRKDGSGVDIVKMKNGGFALGYTAAGEWVEYTVKVKNAGKYTYEANVASGSDVSKFHLETNKNGVMTKLTSTIAIPKGNDWETYSILKGDLTQNLEEGEQTIRLVIDGDYANIDYIKLACPDCSSDLSNIELVSNTYGAGEYAVFNQIGIYLGKVKIENGESFNEAVKQVTGAVGVYVLRNVDTEKSSMFICK